DGGNRVPATKWYSGSPFQHVHCTPTSTGIFRLRYVHLPWRREYAEVEGLVAVWVRRLLHSGAVSSRRGLDGKTSHAGQHGMEAAAGVRGPAGGRCVAMLVARADDGAGGVGCGGRVV